MITEDYVSYETAKLLQENGFDWDNSPFTSTQERDEWKQKYSYTIPNADYNPELPFDSETLTMIAPHVSLQMAMKWLREVKHYYIQVSIQNDGTYIGYIYRTDGFPYVGFDKRRVKSTPEEACGAAIKYCLENLI